MFYMSDLWEAYICFFVFGLGFGGTISVATLYMMEFMMKKHRAFVLMIGMTVEGLTITFLVGYFLYITKYWQYWYIGCTVMQVLAIVGFLWLPESPEFYFAKGRFQESKQVLLQIASINGRPIDERQICFDNVVDTDDNSHDESK